MKQTILISMLLCAWLATIGCSPASPPFPANYRGTPYSDEKFTDSPQKIPGTVFFAAYDRGGEGVAYHDTTPKNLGSGELNPADGTYLNDFRKDEAVDTSYTKFQGEIDNSQYNIVSPFEGTLYVGWTEPGEWLKLTVNVEKSDTYLADILFTANKGGDISFDVNGKPAGVVKLKSTANPDDQVAWRQWHHWDVKHEAIEMKLPKGKCVITVHIVTEGNMNLATMTFKKKEVIPF